MKYVNLTPHIVRLNDGTEFPPSGTVCRVSSTHDEIEPGLFRVKFGEVVGLPQPEADTRYIVSGMIMSACPERTDLVSPATGHPLCVRRDGQVYSVPGFVVGGGK